MSSEGEFTFVIYGLAEDGDVVKGEVFARKMVTLVKALKEADKQVNGGKRHDILVDDLEKGSARVRFRERVISRRKIMGTGSNTLGQAISSVYHGTPSSTLISERLLRYVSELAQGAEATFSHAEAIYDDNNVVRLDKFFISQAESANVLVMQDADYDLNLRYSGSSHEAFYGTLKVVDTRGQLVRAILTLTAGGREIECVLRRELLQDMLGKFETKVLVEGNAIYKKTDLLPKRIEIEHIKVVEGGGSLLSWKGQFKIPEQLDEDGWDDEWQ